MGANSSHLDGGNGTRRNDRRTRDYWSGLQRSRWMLVKALITRRSRVQIPPRHHRKRRSSLKERAVSMGHGSLSVGCRVRVAGCVGAAGRPCRVGGVVGGGQTLAGSSDGVGRDTGRCQSSLRRGVGGMERFGCSRVGSIRDSTRDGGGGHDLHELAVPAASDLGHRRG